MGRRLEYDPPCTYGEVVEKYGKALADRLSEDPAHAWRMETGVELIHREPSLREQRRIWRNWQLMPPAKKRASDRKSVELFGMTNWEHHMRIMAAHRCGGGDSGGKFDLAYEAVMSGVGGAGLGSPRPCEGIRRLLGELSSYAYGVLYNDGEFVTDKEEIARRDGTDIIIQTPEMTGARRAGMCHDVSLCADVALTRMRILHTCVYIASHVAPALPTHSFVVAFDEGRREWVTIDPFSPQPRAQKSLGEAIDARIAEWIRADNGGSPDLDVFTLSHMPKGGVGFVEYSEAIVRSADYYEFGRGYVRVSYRGAGVCQALERAAGPAWRGALQRQRRRLAPEAAGLRRGRRHAVPHDGGLQGVQEERDAGRQALPGPGREEALRGVRRMG